MVLPPHLISDEDLARLSLWMDTNPLQRPHNSSPNYIGSIYCNAIVMKLATSLLDYDRYERWDRPSLCSNKKIRPMYCPLPPGIMTCWDINTAAGGNDSTCSPRVTTCSPCEFFRQEKDLRSHLRVLPSNKNTTQPSNVPVRHHCDTPWSVVNKQKPEIPSAAALPKVDLSSPNKKARLTDSPMNAPAVAAYPSPGSASTFCPPCVSSSPPTDISDSFTAYLLNRVATQTQALNDLGAKNETLTDKDPELLEANDWLHSTKTGAIHVLGY
jgi:hypothetical protein